MCMNWGSESLRQARNDVIEKLINLESIISAIISQYYFKRVATEFYFGMLYNENFSLGLKRSILERIPEVAQSMIQKLNKLMKIRNRFAHCGPQVFWGDVLPAEGEKATIPDPDSWRKPLDFAKLYKEFVEMEPQVTQYFFNFYNNLGGHLDEARG